MSSKKFKPPSSSANSKKTEVKGKNYRLQDASSDTPSSAADSKGYTFTGVTPGKAYLHPPDRLISGRVMYPVKFAGHMFVKDPRGPGLAKDAIDMLLAAAAVKKANTGEDMESVILSVSIRSIMCVQKEGDKKVLHQHPLHFISFSADDKRNKGNIFTYIARSKPPSQNHICYVFQCTGTQAPELTATVGQAFELAYKEFLKTKKAQEDFKQLKERLESCSPEEKEGILKQINSIEVARAQQVAKKRAQEAEKIIAPSAPGEKQMAKKSSVSSKWESITSAFDTFKMESSTDPGTKGFQSDDLDSAFSKLSDDISELEKAYTWKRKGKKRLVVPDTSPGNDKMVEKVEEKLREMETSHDDDDDDDDDDFPYFPPNFVMGSFLGSQGKSSMPKKGSVKAAASNWPQMHHD